MKLLLSSLFLFILYSCGPEKLPKIEGPPYTPGPMTQTFVVAAPPIDTTNAFLIADGNKNDWFCEFYVYKIRFVYNNGKDSVIQHTDFSYNVQNNIILNPFMFKSKEGDFMLEIKDESCKDDAAENIKEKKMTIQLNKKAFSGCARQKINT